MIAVVAGAVMLGADRDRRGVRGLLADAMRAGGSRFNASGTRLQGRWMWAPLKVAIKILEGSSGSSVPFSRSALWAA